MNEDLGVVSCSSQSNPRTVKVNPRIGAHRQLERGGGRGADRLSGFGLDHRRGDKTAFLCRWRTTTSRDWPAECTARHLAFSLSLSLCLFTTPIRSFMAVTTGRDRRSSQTALYGARRVLRWHLDSSSRKSPVDTFSERRWRCSSSALCGFTMHRFPARRNAVFPFPFCCETCRPDSDTDANTVAGLSVQISRLAYLLIDWRNSKCVVGGHGTLHAMKIFLFTMNGSGIKKKRSITKL